MRELLPFEPEPKLTIPGVLPSVNHMYRNSNLAGRRMRVLSQTAEQWKSDIIAYATVWRYQQKWKTIPKGKKVIVNLWYYFPDRRKRDTHNTIKLLLDCLEDALIYENDQYALPRVMDWEVDRLQPRTEITFEVVA